MNIRLRKSFVAFGLLPLAIVVSFSASALPIGYTTYGDFSIASTDFDTANPLYISGSDTQVQGNNTSSISWGTSDGTGTAPSTTPSTLTFVGADEAPNYFPDDPTSQPPALLFSLTFTNGTIPTASWPFQATLDLVGYGCDKGPAGTNGGPCTAIGATDTSTDMKTVSLYTSINDCTDGTPACDRENMDNFCMEMSDGSTQCGWVFENSANIFLNDDPTTPPPLGGASATFDFFGHFGSFDIQFMRVSSDTSGGDGYGLVTRAPVVGVDSNGNNIVDTTVVNRSNILQANFDLKFIAIPEPGMLALFGIGLLGLGLSWRRIS